MNAIFTIFFILMLTVIITSKRKGYSDIIKPEPIIGHGNSDVILTKVENSAKIVILRTLREVTNWDLRTLKYVIEHLPYKIMQNIGEEYAQELQARLKHIGANVEICESEHKV